MPTQALDRALWLIAAALIAAIIGVVVYKVHPLLRPEPLFSAPLDPGCDLRSGPCIARFPEGGVLRFEILPHQIPVLAPLSLRVETQGLAVQGVEVDFAGVDMNMGFNRVALRALGGGRFAGEGMLPTCVRDRMVWEAQVLLQTPGGLVAAPFRFDTTR